jgi:membrane-associated phospholipid phosphatase
VTSLADLDLRALQAFYGGPAGTWAGWMVALTVLGSGWTALAVLPLLALPSTRRFGAALTLAILTQAALVVVLKAAVGRVRPWIVLKLPAPFTAPHDGSFPSGHAAGSFCVAAFLVLALPVAWPASPRAARAVGVATVALAASIASSRVYLGAHFPGDVAAGAILGAVIGGCAAAWYAVGASADRDDSPREAPMERAAERG